MIFQCNKSIKLFKKNMIAYSEKEIASDIEGSDRMHYEKTYIELTIVNIYPSQNG